LGGGYFLQFFYQIAKLSTYPFQSEIEPIKDSQVSVYNLSQNLEAAKTLATSIKFCGCVNICASIFIVMQFYHLVS
jgi:hypothetical protein